MLLVRQTRPATATAALLCLLAAGCSSSGPLGPIGPAAAPTGSSEEPSVARGTQTTPTNGLAYGTISVTHDEGYTYEVRFPAAISVEIDPTVGKPGMVGMTSVIDIATVTVRNTTPGKKAPPFSYDDGDRGLYHSAKLRPLYAEDVCGLLGAAPDLTPYLRCRSGTLNGTAYWYVIDLVAHVAVHRAFDVGETQPAADLEPLAVDIHDGDLAPLTGEWPPEVAAKWQSIARNPALWVLSGYDLERTSELLLPNGAMGLSGVYTP